MTTSASVENKAEKMKVLVIAPHPDDEVLGLGGTIHRLAQEGHEVVVVIATKGWAPLYPDAQVTQARAEAREASKVLGVGDLRFLDLPVTTLHAMPESELNKVFCDLLADVRPDWVFLPFRGDRHEDHRQIFDACMVALRPVPGEHFCQMVLAYETVSETHWNAPGIEPVFEPQYYVDITDHLSAKCEGMRAYASQVRAQPDARSIEAITALATWRGSVIGLPAAEAFMVVRGLYAGAGAKG